MINAKDDEMYSATGFIRNMGMLTYPVKLLMILRTSSEFVVSSSSCSVLFSGSDVIVRSMSDVFTGSFACYACVGVSKNLLISFTFPSKVVPLEYGE